MTMSSSIPVVAIDGPSASGKGTVAQLVAEKLGYEWGVDPSPTHDYHNGMNQMYFMDVEFGKFPSGDFKDFHENWIWYQTQSDHAVITMLDPKVYLIEDQTRMIGHNGALGGIYQCEDYLIDRKDEIYEWFKFKEEYEIKYSSRIS